MSSEQIPEMQLGQVVVKDSRQWLVTRIVNSQGIFQSITGVGYTMDEKYVEIKSLQSGEVDFIVLHTEKSPLERPQNTKWPEAMPWHKL